MGATEKKALGNRVKVGKRRKMCEPESGKSITNKLIPGST
jgi:hypothetical protein